MPSKKQRAKNKKPLQFAGDPADLPSVAQDASPGRFLVSVATINTRFKAYILETDHETITGHRSDAEELKNPSVYTTAVEGSTFKLLQPKYDNEAMMRKILADIEQYSDMISTLTTTTSLPSGKNGVALW